MLYIKTINCFSGPLPKALAFVLIPKDTFYGSFEDSSTYSKPQGLNHFELRLDGQPISLYPLKQKQTMYHSFYKKFLAECNQMANPFSQGSLSYREFVDYNFMIVENLHRKHINQGDLSAYLRFDRDLDETLYIVSFAIDTRTLEFDEYLNVSVTNAVVKEDED